MLEIIGFVFTILAALWVRKQDISDFLCDEDSKIEIINNIILPDSRFRNLSYSVVSFIDKTLERGARFFFSLFMLSLLFVSISFVFSLNFIESKNLFFSGNFAVEDARLAFILFLISIPLTYAVGSTHNRHYKSKNINFHNEKTVERKLLVIKSRSNYRFYYIFSAFLLTFSTYIVYNSWFLTIYTLIISLISANYSKFLSPFFLMREKTFSVAFGAIMGTLGLLLAAFSFASKSLSLADYIFIAGISVVSGVLAVLSLKNCRAVVDVRYSEFWRFVPIPGLFSGIGSSLGRPSLFVGFHCARASGPFCFAVSVILLNVAIARTIVPEAVVSAGAIMLACVVFFSGATTLAGAGFFAFGTVALIGSYMALYPEKLFTIWAAPFLLWILLPLVNSTIDYARWSIARKNLRKYSKSGSPNSAKVVFFDVLFGIFGYTVYVFFAFMFLKIFEAIGQENGYVLPFNVVKITLSMQTDLFHEGIWLLVMAGTTMIPTLMQLCMFLYSGLVFLFPKKYRMNLAAEVRCASSAYQRDIVSWKVSSLDIMGRIVFTAIFIVVITFMSVSFTPAIQKITVFSSSYGLVSGKVFSSWLFAK